LKDLFPKQRYAPHEVTRKDHYIDAYFGKEYGDKNAKEVMTMSIEAVLGVTGERKTLDRFADIMNRDRELANLVVGLLFKWKP
jgi:hypothetical protein